MSQELSCSRTTGRTYVLNTFPRSAPCLPTNYCSQNNSRPVKAQFDTSELTKTRTLFVRSSSTFSAALLMPCPSFEGADACSSGMTVDGPDIFSTGGLGGLRIVVWSMPWWFLFEPWTLDVVVVGMERGRGSLTAFILESISLTYRALEHG